MPFKNSLLLASFSLAAACAPASRDIADHNFTKPARPVGEIAYDEILDCAAASNAFLALAENRNASNAGPAQKFFSEVNVNSHAAVFKHMPDKTKALGDISGRTSLYKEAGPNYSAAYVFSDTCRAFAAPEIFNSFLKWRP